jgi:hypothetical protein
MGARSDEDLAWAAGFFDAEGTACSSQRLDRPSRERQMALYQGGRDVIPDALLRFQRAVGGRGNITGPYRDRLFHWSTKKNSAFDEVMTLLWPWLSDGKRAQLRRATESAGRAMPPECAESNDAPHAGRSTELAWIAGFFDGEGYIGASGSLGGRTIEMSIAQASADALPVTLTRVAFVLGVGRLRGPRTLPDKWSKLPQYEWRAKAFEEVQFAVALLWTWLGPVKRAQAREALQRYRALGRTA